MKFLNSRLVAPALALSTITAALMTGCGSAPNANALMPIGSGGNSLTGSVISGPTTGCYALTAPIPFTATGAFLNTLVMKGGLIPTTVSSPVQAQIPGYPLSSSGYLDPWQGVGTGSSFGSVVLTGGIGNYAIGTGIPGAGSMMISTPSRVDGALQVNVTSPGLTQAGYSSGALITGTTATITGVIQVSPAKATLIAANSNSASQVIPFQMSGNTLPMMPSYNQPCISGVSLSMSYVNSSIFDGGRVFLYLNGTMHGSWLQF